MSDCGNAANCKFFMVTLAPGAPEPPISHLYFRPIRRGQKQRRTRYRTIITLEPQVI